MNQTKKQVTQNPGRDDVHEQREEEQNREGVVQQQGPGPGPAETDQPKTAKPSSATPTKEAKD